MLQKNIQAGSLSPEHRKSYFTVVEPTVSETNYCSFFLFRANPRDSWTTMDMFLATFIAGSQLIADSLFFSHLLPNRSEGQ